MIIRSAKRKNDNAKSILVITSGEAMLPHFSQKFPTYAVIPMNEAMCEGAATKKIFSDKFNEMRASVHAVSKSAYMDKIACYFAPKALKGYDQIELYFDYDMFCGINIITLLAYFEQIKTNAEINFNLISYGADVLSTTHIKLGRYRRLYSRVIVKHKKSKAIVPITDKVIEDYLSFTANTNPITVFIEKNRALSDIDLCVLVIKNQDFADYGLGDTQIYKMIAKCKNSVQ